MIIVAPSSHADSPSAFLAATSIESSSLEGVRVLAVDDDDDARELLRTILESRAATVLVAANAREAFELLAREHPHVLVSDIAMPDEDGYALIRRIRQLSDEAGGRTPAIAVTAHTGPADRARAVQAGFDRHVPKPLDVEILVDAISKLANDPPPESGHR